MIQSLDLAYSVKNVRRDFANGFLVAKLYLDTIPGTLVCTASIMVTLP